VFGIKLESWNFQKILNQQLRRNTMAFPAKLSKKTGVLPAITSRRGLSGISEE
jgi:hypothetical protein